MKKRLFVNLGTLAAVALLGPATAFGDAGTPLMWAGALHLSVGNAVIGIGEGLVLSFLFKCKKRLSIPVMIAANYFSMIIGVSLLDYTSRHASITIYQARSFIWLAAVLSFVATIFLEWPFIMFLLRKEAGWLKKSFRGSCIVQSLSYLVIIPWYLVPSTASLYSGTELVHDLSFSRNQSAFVYYIAPDHNIYRTQLGRSVPELVFETDPRSREANLSLAPSPDGRSCDLYLVPWNAASGGSDKFLVRQQAAANSDGLCTKDENADADGGYDLRPRGQRQWRVSSGFWAADGLRLENEKTGESIRLALETPFIMWGVLDLSVLPDDEVVFQLGDQICLFARKGRKLGLIAKGRSPIAVTAAR